MDTNLFNKKTISKNIVKIEPTLKQKTASKKWIELLEENQLQEEVANYPKFMIYILKDLLGYDITDFKHEEKNMEFPFKDKSGNFLVCFEAKGTKTKDLWALQSRSIKIRETPVNQINDYIYKNKIPYGILTNYKEFVLFKREEGYTKYHKIDFLNIKKNPDKLREFIFIFSKESFEKNDTTRLYKDSIVEERNLTKELYKLYHETRLMILKEFKESELENEICLHYAQLLLNRLMFIFFAEDTELLDRRYFERKISEVLDKNSGIIDVNTKYVFGKIKSIFRELDKEIPRQIKGFNGELFKEEIDDRLSFKDYRNKPFFKEVEQNHKIDKKIELYENDKRIFNKHRNRLSKIIENFLLMASFDFKSEVNVNILGHIFEQSISDIENLKEKKISKSKQEGVFYTPEYVTEYICRNTIIPYLSKSGTNDVNDLIDEYSKDIEELERKFKSIKILDPACGSGAFLIKSTEILFEIFEKIQFVKENYGDYEASRGLKRKSNFKGQLTLKKFDEREEIKNIIENNIYGVDINEESVEITELALFLKIARKNKKLIDLSKNIKQGNSLVSDERVDKRAFNWGEEFKEILDNDGFDIVIGNPPYVRQEQFVEIKPYLKKNYDSYNSLADLYVYFIEKGIKLNKINGSFSFIIPNKFLRATYGKEVRNFIKSNMAIRKIFNFNDYPVFEEAATYPMIFVLDNKQKKDSFIYSEIDRNIFKEPISQLEENKYSVDYNSLNDAQWNFVNKDINNILNKIKTNSISLKDICDNKIFRGVSTGKNEVFIIDEETKHNLLDVDNKQYIRKIVTGKEVKRYSLSFEKKYLLFIPWGYKLKTSEKIKTYLKDHKSLLEGRPEVKEGRFNWWCLSRYGSKNSDYLFKPKIIYPRINNTCNFYLDKSGEMSLSDNNFFISSDSLDLLAILNSNLIFFYLKQICSTLQGGYLDFRRPYIETIPINKNYKKYNLSEKADSMLNLNKKLYNKKNKFFNRINKSFGLKKLNKKLDSFYKLEFNDFIKRIEKLSKKKLLLKEQDEWEDYFNEYKKELLQLTEEISQTDRKINEVVYDLYEIKDKEKEIIEKK